MFLTLHPYSKGGIQNSPVKNHAVGWNASTDPEGSPDQAAAAAPEKPATRRSAAAKPPKSPAARAAGRPKSASGPATRRRPQPKPVWVDAAEPVVRRCRLTSG